MSGNCASPYAIFFTAFRGAENLGLKNEPSVRRGVGAVKSKGIAKAKPYRRIASSWGSKTTLSCSLGSVREMTAVAGSVWLML